MTHNVMSIDIGVKNLGISFTIINDDFTINDIIWIDLYDLTHFKHEKVEKKDCKLHHTKTFSDWIDHFFQEYSDFIEKADFILIERQPPTGFVVVEQLIFNRYREKSFLINPINYHTFLCMRGLSYEGRKIRSIEIANKTIENEDILFQLSLYERKHDISDSICMLLYWLNKKQNSYIKQEKINYANSLQLEGVNINVWLDKFRCK